MVTVRSDAEVPEWVVIGTVGVVLVLALLVQDLLTWLAGLWWPMVLPAAAWFIAVVFFCLEAAWNMLRYRRIRPERATKERLKAERGGGERSDDDNS